jgi:predicted ArsR family transcriptional regulator
MPVAVHPTQAALWTAIEAQKISPSMSLRTIGEILGIDNAQTVKHHLDQLVKKGTIGMKNGKYDW